MYSRPQASFFELDVLSVERKRNARGVACGQLLALTVRGAGTPELKPVSVLRKYKRMSQEAHDKLDKMVAAFKNAESRKRRDQQLMHTR